MRDGRWFARRSERHGWRSWVAVAAAYVLIFQSLWGLLVLGAAASEVRFDAFGGVMCTPAGPQKSGKSNEAPARHHLPACCLLACSMLPAAVLPAAEAAGFDLGILAMPDSAFAPAALATSLASESSRPRAPPLPI